MNTSQYVAIPSSRIAKKVTAINAADVPRLPQGPVIDNAAVTAWRNYKNDHTDPKVVSIDVKRNSRVPFPVEPSAILPRLVPQRSLPFLLAPLREPDDIYRGGGASNTEDATARLDD